MSTAFYASIVYLQPTDSRQTRKLSGRKHFLDIVVIARHASKRRQAKLFFSRKCVTRMETYNAKQRNFRTLPCKIKDLKAQFKAFEALI